MELISREETSGTYFYILDGGNTVRALVDEEGNVTDRYVFDSFGNEISHEGESSNSYGFQGEQLDEETGLYYLRARYMSPSTGTFTSMDTYGGTLSDPASLHKYLFANSNPVKYCDPTGHDGETIAQEMAAIGIMLVLMSVVTCNLQINYMSNTYNTWDLSKLYLFDNDGAIGILGKLLLLLSSILFAKIPILEDYNDYYDDEYYDADNGGVRPQGSNNKTPRNNKDQNKEFEEAMRRIGKLADLDFCRRVHEEISGKGYDMWEIIRIAKSMLSE